MYHRHLNITYNNYLYYITEKDNKEAETSSKELTYMPNVIVKVETDKPCTRKELKVLCIDEML